MQVELLSTKSSGRADQQCQAISGQQKRAGIMAGNPMLSAPWALDLSRLLIFVIRKIRRGATIGADCMVLAPDAVLEVESHCRASRRMRLSAADDVRTSARRGPDKQCWVSVPHPRFWGSTPESRERAPLRGVTESIICVAQMYCNLAARWWQRLLGEASSIRSEDWLAHEVVTGASITVLA